MVCMYHCTKSAYNQLTTKCKFTAKRRNEHLYIAYSDGEHFEFQLFEEAFHKLNCFRRPLKYLTQQTLVRLPKLLVLEKVLGSIPMVV